MLYSSTTASIQESFGHDYAFTYEEISNDDAASRNRSHATNAYKDNEDDETFTPNNDSYYESYLYQQDHFVNNYDHNAILENKSYNSNQGNEIVCNKYEHRQNKKCSSTPMSLPSSHIPRTHSEIQLTEDKQVAEWRDYQMYRRLTNGIALNSVKQNGCFMPSAYGALSKIEQVHNKSIEELDGLTSLDDDSGWEKHVDSIDSDYVDDVFAMDM